MEAVSGRFFFRGSYIGWVGWDCFSKKVKSPSVEVNKLHLFWIRDTCWIIPVSKWLVTPPLISHEVRPFGSGITPVRGFTITMVAKYFQVMGWSSKHLSDSGIGFRRLLTPWKKNVYNIAPESIGQKIAPKGKVWTSSKHPFFRGREMLVLGSVIH